MGHVKMMAAAQPFISGAISKTVNEYILENYKNHLNAEPRLIYRGSDQDYFTKQFQVTEQYQEKFFSQFSNTNLRLTFSGSFK